MPKRPGKASPDARTRRLAVRLSGAEDARFRAKATAAGRSPSDFFREVIERSHVIARPAPTVDRRRVLFLVNKASNNLNQLAHQVNAAHLAGMVDLRTYPKVLVELEMISTYLRTLARDVD